MTTNNVASTVNNNLQDALATLINKTVTGADAATSFLQQQVPDVIHQLLVWKMVGACITIVSLLLLFIAAFAVFWKWYKYAKAKIEIHSWDNEAMKAWVFCLSLSSFVYGIFGGWAFFHSISTILQIWIAPKVWLIEYAAKLLKGN